MPRQVKQRDVDIAQHEQNKPRDNQGLIYFAEFYVYRDVCDKQARINTG